MKVVLESKEQRNLLLKEAQNLKRLKKGGLHKIFIHQDMTPKERDARKNLVKMIQERISKGETNLIIYNVKIVERKVNLVSQKI